MKPKKCNPKMPDDVDYKVTINYGYSELKSFYRVEDSRLVYYGYRIDYDLEGNETGRTEPEAYGSIG